MEAVLAPFWKACRLTSQGKKLPLFIGNLPFDATEEDLRTLLTTNDCLARVAGTQKVAKRKVRATAPHIAFVLVYILGDEMYKWVNGRASQVGVCKEVVPSCVALRVCWWGSAAKFDL